MPSVGIAKDTRDVRRREKRSCPAESRLAHPRPLAEGITNLSQRTSPFLPPQGFPSSWQNSENGAGTNGVRSGACSVVHLCTVGPMPTFRQSSLACPVGYQS